MSRGRIIATTLVALVSLPGFLVGQKLQQGDHINALMLLPLMFAVVFVASLLMRQSE